VLDTTGLLATFPYEPVVVAKLDESGSLSKSHELNLITLLIYSLKKQKAVKACFQLDVGVDCDKNNLSVAS